MLLLASLACAVGPPEQSDTVRATVEALSTEAALIGSDPTAARATAASRLVDFQATMEASGFNPEAIRQTAVAELGSIAGDVQAYAEYVTVEGSRVTQWAFNAEGEGAPEALVGLPDTPTCGQAPTAWPTGTPADTVTMEFLVPVEPQTLTLYEVNAPGGVVGITVQTIFNETIQVPITAEGGAACPGTIIYDLSSVPDAINRITLTTSGGAYQIDAVLLVGQYE